MNTTTINRDSETVDSFYLQIQLTRQVFASVAQRLEARKKYLAVKGFEDGEKNVSPLYREESSYMDGWAKGYVAYISSRVPF